MFAMNRSVVLTVARHLIPLACAAIMLGVGVPARAQQLIAPDATIASFSQSYLSARWTQWLASYTAPTNPSLDTTGAFSALGDQGSYFFLTGTFGTEPVVRNVTVRSDQVLFFPLVNILSMIPYYGSTEAEIRADASDNLGIASNLSVTIDGAPALLPPGVSSLDDFRQYSPLFPMTFIADNILDVPPSVLDSVTDGYWVGLEALPVGSHELTFTAQINGIGAYTGFEFSQDITYHINSVREASSLAMLGLGLLAVVAITRRPRGDVAAR